MLWEQKDIVKRWKEYLEILYEGETLKEIESNEEEEYEKDPVMREKFDKALKNLKNKKQRELMEYKRSFGRKQERKTLKTDCSKSSEIYTRLAKCQRIT